VREQQTVEIRQIREEGFLMESSNPIALSSAVPGQAQVLLARMFRDPSLLEAEERVELICDLRAAVEMSPQLAELRVLLGMVLCVDLKVQEAMEVLREAARMDPNSFLAHLKFGELLMRLRVCDQAVEETRKAALLASNSIQSELARRQAATLRTMMREGIERGGYRGPLKAIAGLWCRLSKQDRSAETSLVRPG
jgi:tetratricopeptide (TPR) repeat protein